MVSKYAKMALFALLIAVTSIGLTLAITSNPLNTAIPAVTIEGPDRVTFNELLEYHAVANNLSWFADKPIWQWKVIESNSLPIDFRLLPPGDTIIFAANQSAKRYFICVSGFVHYNYLLWGKETPMGVFVKEVTTGVGPNPGPHPHPPSPDVIPDGKFGIARVAFENFPRENKELAREIEKNYTDVAKDIDDETITSLKDAFAKIQVKNKESIEKMRAGDDLVGWGEKIKNHIKEIYGEKKLTQISDCSDLFKEIAVGLSYVK